MEYTEYGTAPLVTTQISTTKLMERIRYADKRIIAESVMRATEFELVEDTMHGLVINMSTSVLADKLADETIVCGRSYAEWTSWWQHTKAVHFPTLSRWLRRPPRTRQVMLDVEFHVRQWVSFPEAKIEYPEHLGDPVYVEMVTPWPVVEP